MRSRARLCQRHLHVWGRGPAVLRRLGVQSGLRLHLRTLLVRKGRRAVLPRSELRAGVHLCRRRTDERLRVRRSLSSVLRRHDLHLAAARVLGREGRSMHLGLRLSFAVVLPQRTRHAAAHARGGVARLVLLGRRGELRRRHVHLRRQQSGMLPARAELRSWSHMLWLGVHAAKRHDVVLHVRLPLCQGSCRLDRIGVKAVRVARGEE